MNFNGGSSPTDEIIIAYENKINSSIASKILAASRKGKVPNFTSEEISYLNKKSSMVNDNAEMKVTTPDPTITLQKGNTTLKIKNAATIVKKMEELKHTNNDKVEESNLEEIDDNQVQINVEEISQPKKEWNVKVKEEPIQSVAEVKTVNRNAYEIRTDVLVMAIDWLKFKRVNASSKISSNIEDDDVLDVASKFYKFVENKR